jgi:excisionase family DNA binding protein
MIHPSADGCPDDRPAAGVSIAKVTGYGQLLTTREVARLFRVARSTVTSWAYRGLLPYTTTPTGHLRFYRSSIERRLAERRDSGPDEGG